MDEHRCLDFFDLPETAIQQIVGIVDMRQYMKLRCISTKFRDICDELLKQKFDEKLRGLLVLPEERLSYNILKYMRMCSMVYLRCGFAPLFFGCFVQIMPEFQQPKFTPTMQDLQTFIARFYKAVELSIDEPQFRLLLHSLTFLRLLKKLDAVVNVTENEEQSMLEIVLALKHRPYKVLWRLKSIKFIALQILLTELCLYVGSDCSPEQNAPTELERQDPVKTTIIFKIVGTKTMRQLFRKCWEQNHEFFSWNSNWPNEKFKLNLDFTSTGTLPIGMNANFSMVFDKDTMLVVEQDEEKARAERRILLLNILNSYNFDN